MFEGLDGFWCWESGCGGVQGYVRTLWKRQQEVYYKSCLLFQSSTVLTTVTKDQGKEEVEVKVKDLWEVYEQVVRGINVKCINKNCSGPAITRLRAPRDFNNNRENNPSIKL